jgi:uncharacterized membrane protein YbaN (DUF454 family)
MNILIIIGCILVAVWAAGLVLHLLAGLFHIILIVAIAMIIYGFIRRKARI